jgi:proteasome activator subunit 4
VEGRLADARHEVRLLAAATLAGLLQGPAAFAAPALRAKFAAAAAADARARAAARRARPAGAKAAPPPAGEELAAAHALVLGLSACVLACPYDCPPWLPPLVGALAGAARSPAAPVRASVESTFADFKRTHADTWDATRAAFGEEAWAVAADGLALAPSYFC